MFRQTSLFFLIAALVVSGNASDINWNSTIGADNYTSAGAPNTMGGDFFFELGAFEDDFEPTAANVSEWASKWVSLDRTEYNPTNKFFASKASLTSNAQPFHPATRPYIWGFNQADPGEWLLVTNPGWFWPFAGGGPQPPQTWSIAAAGTTAVVGAINGSGFQMMTAQVAEGPPDVNPDAWQQQFFNAAERNDPAISGWNADPDNDGANNLFELAAGTNPKSTSSSPAPTIDLVDIGSGAKELQLTLPRAHRAAISYSAECSGDLSIWSSSEVWVESEVTGEIVLRFPASGGRHFARFVFTL